MLIMYVTDARPQYITNMLTTLGLPRGGHNQYRYDRRWIEPSVWQRFRDGASIGERILICFLQGNGSGLTASAKAWPVRFGKLARADVAGHFAVLEVDLECFVGSRHVLEPRVEDSDGFVKPGPREGFFVTDAACYIPTVEPDDLLDWQDSVDNLRRLDAFLGASYIYVDGIIDITNGSRITPNNGVFEIRAGREYELTLYSVVPATSPGIHVYRTQTDTALTITAGSNELKFGHKFSAARIPFASLTRKNGSQGQIRLSPEMGLLGPDLVLRFRLRRGHVRRALAVGAPASAAAIAASAGVLPDNAPLWLKIGMVISGSAGLALISASNDRV